MTSDRVDRLPDDPDAQAEVFGHVRQAHSMESTEDYVELIDDLIRTHGEARLVELAERLGISQPTAGKTVARLQRDGLEAIAGALDAQTADRIDLRNPARVMRAWEVLQTTGKGLAQWQDETPAPLLPLDHAQTALFDAPKDWLTPRIETRFHKMIAAGALDEARANLATWSPALPASKAIGAAELIAVLQDQMTLPEAITRATILTRQFAKRQRTWFKARMKAWQPINPAVLT